MDQLLAATGDASWLASGLDRKRIGVSGLSLGGATTLLVTYHPKVRDKRVRAALAIAPALACAMTRAAFHAARPPILLLGGDQDLLVPFEDNGGKVFKQSRSPRTIVTLAQASHTAFTGLITFDSQVSYDTFLGCPAIAEVANWGDPFTGLTGPGTGLKPVVDKCGLPCSGPAPTNPPMQATVQQAITLSVVAAFFEGTLGGSADARCFLRRRLAAENPAVTVRTRPGR
jgi:predicted dienelactone hydrolase